MSDKARNAIAARTAVASFHFSSQQRVCLSAVPTVCRRRRDRPYSTVGGGWPGSPGGDKRGQETILGVLSPFVPAGEHRHPRRRRRPLHTLTLSVNLASSGAPLYRRRLCHLLQIKQKTIYTMRHIGRCANRESRFSSKNVAFSLALCAQYTV